MQTIDVHAVIQICMVSHTLLMYTTAYPLAMHPT